MLLLSLLLPLPLLSRLLLLFEQFSGLLGLPRCRWSNCWLCCSSLCCWLCWLLALLVFCWQLGELLGLLCCNSFCCCSALLLALLPLMLWCCCMGCWCIWCSLGWWGRCCSVGCWLCCSSLELRRAGLMVCLSRCGSTTLVLACVHM